MRIKLLVDLSGMRNGIDWPKRGTVVDLPEDEARSMIRAGMGAESEDDVMIESAVAPEEAETATVPAKPGLTTKTGPTRRAASTRGK